MLRDFDVLASCSMFCGRARSIPPSLKIAHRAFPVRVEPYETKGSRICKPLKPTSSPPSRRVHNNHPIAIEPSALKLICGAP
jgi:hypothetical protein